MSFVEEADVEKVHFSGKCKAYWHRMVRERE